MTRAGPAKSLGLAACAVASSPAWMQMLQSTTSTRRNRSLTLTTSKRRSHVVQHVFKCGVEVVENGEIVGTGNKRTLWVNAKVKDNPQVMRDINEKFLKYYSITQANYESLGHHFVPNPYALEVDAT